MKKLFNLIVFFRSRKGALTPFLLFITIIMLMMAVLSIYVSMAFYVRGIARNAFDSAMFSAILSSTSIEAWPTHYSYTRKCTDWDCWTDNEGRTHCSCDHWVYYDTEDKKRKFIYLNESNAINVFNAYLEYNIESNFDNAEIVSTTFEVVEYDDQRYLDLYKNRILNRADTNSHTYLTTNPHSWWLDYDFKNLVVPPAWNSNENYELRTINWPQKPNLSYDSIDGPVPFPRWVKAKATAKIKVHFSYSNAFFGGGRDITYNFEQEIVREMLEDDVIN